MLLPSNGAPAIAVPCQAAPGLEWSPLRSKEASGHPDKAERAACNRLTLFSILQSKVQPRFNCMELWLVGMVHWGTRLSGAADQPGVDCISRRRNVRGSKILRLSTTLSRTLTPFTESRIARARCYRGLLITVSDGLAFSNLGLSDILTSVGDAHDRQRGTVSPAFGFVEPKGLLPCFVQYTTKVGSFPTSIWRCD